MDAITQGIIGAVAAGSCAPKQHERRWALAGGLAGLAPDLDVLIRSPSDPLLFLEFHRHFTHSLFFIPFGAALVAGVLSLLYRGRSSFSNLFGPCLLGFATHGLLDACTSYGTSLFWPASSERVAWNIISIVDPLFTGLLIAGLVTTLRTQRRRWVHLGALLGAFYLGFGCHQHQRAQAHQKALAGTRGHLVERSEVKPSFGNNFLFRSCYQSDQTYFVDAIRIPWWGPIIVYPGGHIPRLDPEEFIAAHALSPKTENDVRRFAHFSKAFLIEDPHHPNVIGDLRYALLPNDIAPLWGIQWSADPSPGHTPFLTFRSVSAKRKDRFLRMLRGEAAQ